MLETENSTVHIDGLVQNKTLRKIEVAKYIAISAANVAVIKNLRNVPLPIKAIELCNATIKHCKKIVRLNPKTRPMFIQKDKP